MQLSFVKRHKFQSLNENIRYESGLVKWHEHFTANFCNIHVNNLPVDFREALQRIITHTSKLQPSFMKNNICAITFTDTNTYFSKDVVYMYPHRPKYYPLTFLGARS